MGVHERKLHRLDAHGWQRNAREEHHGEGEQPGTRSRAPSSTTFQLGSIDVSKTSSDSGAQEGAVFTLYSGTDTTGTVVGMCTVNAGGHCDSDDASYDNPSFDDLVAGNYTLDETTVPAGYDKDADLPKTDIVLGAEQDLTFSFENVAQPGSVLISKTDDAGDPLAGVTFQLYEDDNGTPGDAISGASCTTDDTGACAIQNVVARDLLPRRDESAERV